MKKIVVIVLSLLSTGSLFSAATDPRPWTQKVHDFVEHSLFNDRTLPSDPLPAKGIVRMGNPIGVCYFNTSLHLFAKTIGKKLLDQGKIKEAYDKLATTPLHELNDKNAAKTDDISKILLTEKRDAAIPPLALLYAYWFIASPDFKRTQIPLFEANTHGKDFLAHINAFIKRDAKGDYLDTLPFVRSLHLSTNGGTVERGLDELLTLLNKSFSLANLESIEPHYKIKVDDNFIRPPYNFAIDPENPDVTRGIQFGLSYGHMDFMPLASGDHKPTRFISMPQFLMLGGVYNSKTPTIRPTSPNTIVTIRFNNKEYRYRICAMAVNLRTQAPLMGDFDDFHVMAILPGDILCSDMLVLKKVGAFETTFKTGKSPAISPHYMPFIKVYAVPAVYVFECVDDAPRAEADERSTAAHAGAGSNNESGH